MPLKKITKSILWDKGLDTKTNPKLTDGFLELDNCRIRNMSLEKSDGLEKIAYIPENRFSSENYTVNCFTSFNQLNVCANNEVYNYDPLSGDTNSRGDFRYIERSFSAQLSTNLIPLFYSEFGLYGILIYSVPEITPYKIRVVDLSNGNVVKEIPFIERPIGLISIDFGFVYYTQPVIGGVVNEHFIPYLSLDTPTITNSVLPSAKPVVSGGNMYPGFKTISLEYDGSYVWIFYYLSDGNPHVTVRSPASTTIREIPNSVLGLPINSRTIVDFSDYRYANLNSLYYGKNPIVLDTAVSYTALLFCEFFNSITIFDVATISFIKKIDLPPINVIGYFSNSIAYIQSDQSLVVLQEDLAEYALNSGGDNISSRVFPYTIKNNLLTSSWVVDNFSRKQPQNYSPNVLAFGRGFVTGSLWATTNNAYFVIQSLAYCYNPNILTQSSDTSFNLRNGNFYITDLDYSIVDFPLHYNGTSKTTKTGTAPNIKATVYPDVIIDTKENRFSEQIPYLVNKKTQTRILSGDVTYDTQATIYDVKLPNITKIYNFDYGKSGYFGISNIFSVSETNVEFSQFLDFPTITVYPSNPAGYWTYAVTFEYTNPNSDLVRSSPSIYKQGDVTGNSTYLYFTPPCALETKKGVVVSIWRTTKNSQTFYLLARLTYTNGSPLFFYDDNGSGQIIPDDSISKNEIAYFNGGVLGEIPFDSNITAINHGNAVFSVSLENPYLIQYSLPQQPTVGLATAFGFELLAPSLGGPIVELASLDDKLIIFKKNYIFVIVGNPPDALGNNSTLSTAQQITSPVGCSERSSVVRIPEIPGAQSTGGVLFKSSKGIYILDRALSLSYIGAPVEKFNDLEIISSSVSTDENTVRFNTSSGVILTYDYFYNTWQTESGLTLVSTTVYDGDFVGVSSPKLLFRASDYYYKNNFPYSMTIKTPWVKLAGLQGFQRIYKLFVLGDFKDTSVLSLGIMYDYVEQVSQWLYYRKDVSHSYGAAPSWGSLDVFGSNEKSNFEIQFNMPVQKCQAIRFVIKDGFDNLVTDTGNSFTLTELYIIAGIESEEVKLPVSRRA